MVETQELWIALVLYGLAGLVTWSLVWLGSRFLPGRNARLFVRLATLAILLVPWTEAGDSALFVPVVIVGGFALMDTGMVDAVAAWRPLLWVLVALAGLVAVKAAVEWRRRATSARNKQNNPEEN